jgi:transposase InsO family protein
MDGRLQFVAMYLSHEWSMAALCQHFAVSRRIGYKWIRRYLEGGPAGLVDQSRAPHHHPHAVPVRVVEAVVATRCDHPSWGPRKLQAFLEREFPRRHWPTTSTIGEILRCRGLSAPRRRCRKTPPYTQPFTGCDGPNNVWSADLKGWFTTGDGCRCDPLTISDNYSRYLVRCQAVDPAAYEGIQPVFVAAFQEYGLPLAIRTDNGPPFATSTVGGLSRLSIWWIKLGIRPERIEPGHPEQNGRHERMHRTLKRETATPPRENGRRQQQAFDCFRREYNELRPHESLDYRTPASLYVASPRLYPLVLPEMTYPEDMALRWVKAQGDISWRNHHIYLSETLAGELVGLREVADDRWDIYFGPVRLAQLDDPNRRLIHLPRTHSKKTTVNRNAKPNNQKCYLCRRSKV